MKHPVKVPNVGESITEVFIGTWLKQTGDVVKKDDILVDLETQKTSFELAAEFSGRIEILFPEPESKVKPGDVIAVIDDSAAGEVSEESPTPVSSPSPQASAGSPAGLAATEYAPLGPAARKRAAEQGRGTGGRAPKEDVLAPGTRTAPRSSPEKAKAPVLLEYSVDESRGERREPATRIRRTIANNLVAAQHTAAILTTFNEVDMTQVMEFRKKHKESFKEKHGVSLGMVGFFAKACVRALKEFPTVNATYTGEDIIQRDFVDLSIAVSTEAGLVVPVLRDVDQMNLVAFEKGLAELGEKARNKKLSIPEMTGGTFTISNGGVFGSLLSTPILNMPQSGILGLHKIEKRAAVLDDQVVIRPMMYLALSYDHRIIDGKEAVSFLVRVKEGIENLSEIVTDKDLG